MSDVTRIYQFLTKQGNWINEADKNGDGILVKYEAKAYLLDCEGLWTAEDTDASKKDLINKFWKELDTTKSGKIAGSTKSNLDALDKKEIGKMQEKIEIYDAAMQFAEGLVPPSGANIKDETAWSKSVQESILNRVETYIKQGGKLDGLQEFLEGIQQEVVVITTADYIAQDLIKEKLGDIEGYKSGDDPILKKIIDKYIEELRKNPDTDGATISDTVTKLVNAYVSTAEGMPSDSDIELLGKYGYKVTAESTLNDLQKAVLRNNLTQSLESIKNSEQYEKYSELYDKAIEEYITRLCTTSNFGNFNTIKNSGINEFQASKEFKGLQTEITVTELFSSDNLKNKIASEIGSVIAEKIGGAMKGELPTLDKIMNDTIAKAKNGDFGDPLDVNKVIDYAISQIKAKLADFYPNGMNGLSTTEMGVLYKALEKSAVDSQKPDDLKNAAIMYCKGIIGKKSNAFKEAVSEIFGEDYAQTIKSLTSSEIQKMMADLLAKVEELGDASTFRLSDSDSIWGIFQSKSTATIEMRKSEAIGSLGRSCTIDGKNIATDRITYSSSNSSLISINDSGEVTLNGGSSAGEFQVKVNILIDGIIVGTKTINITVTKVQTFDLPEYDNNECVDIGSGENGGGWANIGNHKDNEAFSDMTLMANCAATCYGNLKGIIDNIVNACKSAGIYDTAALDKAAQKTKELYENALKELFTNRAGKGDSKVVKYNNYNMYSYTEKYASGTEGKSPVSQKASNGDLGITLRISYSNNDTYKCEVNTTCVKDILQKFYREALGV